MSALPIGRALHTETGETFDVYSRRDDGRVTGAVVQLFDEPWPPPVYHHRKTGGDYVLLGRGRRLDTGEELAVYRPLYPSEHSLFARPAAMFFERLEDGQGRFVLLRSEEPIAC